MIKGCYIGIGATVCVFTTDKQCNCNWPVGQLAVSASFYKKYSYRFLQFQTVSLLFLFPFFFFFSFVPTSQMIAYDDVSNSMIVCILKRRVRTFDRGSVTDSTFVVFKIYPQS